MLALFAIVTVVMLYFAAQLQVDAGFKKQIPLGHEYMQTFLDYEQEFGGANRVLVAVIDKSGSIFNLPSCARWRASPTTSSRSIESRRRAGALDLHAERALRRGRRGRLRRRQRDPGASSPRTSRASRPRRSSSTTIRSNIVKANAVGRYVAKDFSGAMIWAELVPEGGAGQQQARLPEGRRPARGDPRRSTRTTTPRSTSSASPRWSATSADGARSVMAFFLVTIALTWLLLYLYSTSVKLASLTVFAALIAVIWMLGRAAAAWASASTR